LRESIRRRTKVTGGFTGSCSGVDHIGSDYNVYALNAKIGAKLWRYLTGGAVISSPAVANGMLYLGSHDATVYAFGLR
jgi:outer membrane protein assembly factor BamB